MRLKLDRRAALATSLMALCVCALSPAAAQEKLRFAVGPFQPSPSDTRKAYEPFFKHIADALRRDYDLVVTNDWAGIAIALANKQADVAWMGPWGYVERVASLDPDTAVSILTLMREIAHARRMAIVCTLHQPRLAHRFADRVLEMGAGRLVAGAAGQRNVETTPGPLRA